MDKNTEKLTVECLQILIKDLRHLQHGLNVKLQMDDFLHNKLITACQEIEPYKLYDDLDTRSLYGERLYGPIFRNLLTITRTTSLVRKSTAYTAVSATC